MDENINENPVVITNVYGDVCIRKARNKRRKALVQEMFYDYATNTTLHGLPYTTKRGLTIVEKIFWLITFIVSICLCTYLIHSVWVKWKTSPVIVSVSEKLVSVRTVPFPSVLICPQSKCKATVYNYTAELSKIRSFTESNPENVTFSEKDFAKFQDIGNVCRMGFFSSPVYVPQNFSDESLVETIHEVAPKRKDIFLYCVLWGKSDPYCESISETLTSEGLCFSFNSLAAQELLRKSVLNNIKYLSQDQLSANWTDEYGYTEFSSEVYPFRGRENGATPDLEFLLQESLIDRDHTCNGLNSGYRVYIQHPADFPQSSLYYFAVLNKQVSSMALSFTVLNTSETLKKYGAEIRQCYFPGDKYLKYFKIYTLKNCEFECLINVTFEMCKCVPFYMPHESKIICTLQSMNCVQNARDKMVDIEASKNRTCSCLPSCYSVEYDAEILKTEFNMNNLLQVLNITADDNIQYSSLEIYFKRPRFVSMYRSELFGLTDFLANIGGLLGLFLGFSFLSLVELFYFLTLRLWCTLKKDLKEEKMERLDNVFKKF